jgi:quinolinate synthase
MISAEVEELELAHPDALVIAHPECTEEILREADYIGSTKQMIDYVAKSDAQEFIVLTVVGVKREMELATVGTGKRFYFPRTTPICVNMAKVTPEKVLACLQNGTGDVELPECLDAATTPLERMLELAAR